MAVHEEGVELIRIEWSIRPNSSCIVRARIRTPVSQCHALLVIFHFVVEGVLDDLPTPWTSQTFSDGIVAAFGNPRASTAVAKCLCPAVNFTLYLQSSGWRREPHDLDFVFPFVFRAVVKHEFQIRSICLDLSVEHFLKGTSGVAKVSEFPVKKVVRFGSITYIFRRLENPQGAGLKPLRLVLWVSARLRDSFED